MKNIKQLLNISISNQKITFIGNSNPIPLTENEKKGQIIFRQKFKIPAIVHTVPSAIL